MVNKIWAEAYWDKEGVMQKEQFEILQCLNIVLSGLNLHFLFHCPAMMYLTSPQQWQISPWSWLRTHI